MAKLYTSEQVDEYVAHYRQHTSINRQVDGSWIWHVPIGTPGWRTFCIDNQGREPNYQYAAQAANSCLKVVKKTLLSIDTIKPAEMMYYPALTEV